ncbi:MAG TPA: hypothetical protein VF267_12975, partial [Gammaproteobacteria bacterium]
MRIAWLLLVFPPAFDVQAAEFERIDVRLEDDVYHVHAEARIDAGMSAVRAVITDYNHMHWITGAVQEAEVLERPEQGIAIIYVQSRACFAIFCKTIEQVQRVNARDERLVVFDTLP